MSIATSWVLLNAVRLLCVWTDTVYGIRSCYVCSGVDCMKNPHNRSLSPGLIQCHPVMEYCTTHFRYVVKNESLESGQALQPSDYLIHSGTRSCAKTYLGNLCRRDYLGKPHITCITTCDTDYCNCDSRSPPPEMFVDGKVLFESPKDSTYFDHDLKSCFAAKRSAKIEQTLEAARKRRLHKERLEMAKRKGLKLHRRISEASMGAGYHMLLILLSFTSHCFLL